MLAEAPDLKGAALLEDDARMKVVTELSEMGYSLDMCITALQHARDIKEHACIMLLEHMDNLVNNLKLLERQKRDEAARLLAQQSDNSPQVIFILTPCLALGVDSCPTLSRSHPPLHPPSQPR